MATVAGRSMVVIQVGHQVRHGKERFATDRLKLPHRGTGFLVGNADFKRRRFLTHSGQSAR
jgi:hypothetical protein